MLSSTDSSSVIFCTLSITSYMWSFRIWCSAWWSYFIPSLSNFEHTRSKIIFLAPRYNSSRNLIFVSAYLFFSPAFFNRYDQPYLSISSFQRRGRGRTEHLLLVLTVSRPGLIIMPSLTSAIVATFSYSLGIKIFLGSFMRDATVIAMHTRLRVSAAKGVLILLQY